MSLYAANTGASLLADLQGQQPPRPAWFSNALAMAPEREWVEVDGACVEMLTWGEQGKPGLLFLHGNAAHADWWSFIAPLFAQDYRVAAFSWSGMGNSDWRDTYSIEGYANEIDEVAKAAGLFESDTKPIVIAHSFGSFPALLYAATRGDKLGGLVSMDTPILSPEQRLEQGRRGRNADDLQPHRVYPTMEGALTRFRLIPVQPCDNLYIVDYVARKSLTVTPPSDPQGMGYTWCFDPFLWRELTVGDPTQHVTAARCPLAFIRGAESVLMDDMVKRNIQELAPSGTPIFEIPHAHHHLMMDQPLGLVSGLRGLLSMWPQR